MSKKFITLEGEKEFAALLNKISGSMESRIMRDIARKGGRVVVKRARVDIPGNLGKQIKKDIGVVGDRRDKSGVIVKLRSKKFSDKKGKDRIVSSIALHKTEGAKQNTRKTKKGYKRGKESRRFSDFIKESGKNNQSEVIRVMQSESKNIIDRTIKRYARKR